MAYQLSANLFLTTLQAHFFQPIVQSLIAFFTPVVADFWIIETFYYEQPNVTHMNEMIVIVYTDEKTYHTGTTDELNKLLSNSDGVNGIIDIQTDDHNNDGLAEEITVNIGLTGVTPSEIKSVVLLQSFNYGI